MSIVIPKYRVYDDANSIQSPLALALQKRPEPQYTVFWDLIPWRDPIRQLTYDIASRSITARQVVLGAQILTNDTAITIDSTTKVRVTASHVLYHPATKQRFVLKDMNQTTGVANIRSVVQANGGSRTLVANGETLYILAASENFDEINAESRYEDTSYERNYIQDTTELLRWSLADLRELRKWGIDKNKRLDERMRDIMKDLNSALLYNAPLAAASGVSAMTCGFDYIVEKLGLVVNAQTSGTADLADIRSILKSLVKNGVGPADGLAIHMGYSAYYAYEEAGLQDFNLQAVPNTDIVVGNTVKGLHFSGLGFVPFYPDATVVDDRVRFVATNHAGKAYYQGLGEGAILESGRVVDEPSKSDSKNEVSTWQQKWGTVWENTDKVHAILDKTGL